MVFLRQVGANVTVQTGDFPLRAKNRAREQALSICSVRKSKSKDYVSTADLTENVDRQFHDRLLVVSFYAVVRQFQYLLHCSPREGLTKTRTTALGLKCPAI